MKWNRRLRGLSGEALLLRLNVTLQLVKEFIRFCAWELIMCGITAFEAQGPDELLTTGTGFGVLFPFEMAHESCRCSSSRRRSLHRSHLVTFAIDDLSRFAFFILLTSVLRALWLVNRFSDDWREVWEIIFFIMELILFSPMGWTVYQVSSLGPLLYFIER